MFFWYTESEPKSVISVRGISFPAFFENTINVCFHGQIIFKDPIIKPVRTANVVFS